MAKRSVRVCRTARITHRRNTATAVSYQARISYQCVRETPAVDGESLWAGTCRRVAATCLGSRHFQRLGFHSIGCVSKTCVGNEIKQARVSSVS